MMLPLQPRPQRSPGPNRKSVSERTGRKVHAVQAVIRVDSEKRAVRTVLIQGFSREQTFQVQRCIHRQRSMPFREDEAVALRIVRRAYVQHAPVQRDNQVHHRERGADVPDIRTLRLVENETA